MPVDIQRIEMNQLACWRVRRGEDELLIAEQGAQILSYRQGDAPPIIWLSEEAAFEQGQSVRGGVPVCWPWFGDLARNPQEVQRATTASNPRPSTAVRALPWQLREQRGEGDTAILEFHCPQALGALPGWPHRVELTLQIRTADELELSLSSRNVGTQAVTISRPCTATSPSATSIRFASKAGRLPLHRYAAGLAAAPAAERRLAFNGETDRIYLQLPTTLKLIDPAWKRSIQLTTRGSRSAVLWNPGSTRPSACPASPTTPGSAWPASRQPTCWTTPWSCSRASSTC